MGRLQGIVKVQKCKFQISIQYAAKKTFLGKIILELPKTPLKVTVVSVAKKNGQMIYDKSTENLIRYELKDFK